MSDEDIYRKLFVAESRENHEVIVRNLLVLEEGSDDEAIDEIFRSAHTLKGMSASMGYHEMEHLCHSMEDVFDLIRNGHISVTQELMDTLLACTDMIEEMLDDIENGGDSSSISADHLVADLRKFEQETGEAQAKEESGYPATGYRLVIDVEDACMMKDIRALLVLQNLEMLGTIVQSTPSAQELEDGTEGFSGRLVVEMDSDAGADRDRQCRHRGRRYRGCSDPPGARRPCTRIRRHCRRPFTREKTSRENGKSGKNT
ncbi:MAG: hypothetical protein GKC04_03490 [Methanomicrobiales archaeon]|nr:hypothetical protein [Methanomicrobiales archaeon]